MIEIVDVKPEEVKGTNAKGNFHFFKQKAVLRTVDRDGIQEVRAFTVLSEPGETYEPGSDYALSPDCLYLARDEKGNDVLRVRRSIKLIRVAAARPALSKAA